MTSDPAVTTTLDVRAVALSLRHDAIFTAFRAMELGDHLEITDDEDPKALYYKFQLEAPGNFSWTYLDSGPGFWRVDVRKLGRT